MVKTLMEEELARRERKKTKFEKKLEKLQEEKQRVSVKRANAEKIRALKDDIRKEKLAISKAKGYLSAKQTAKKLGSSFLKYGKQASVNASKSYSAKGKKSRRKKRGGLDFSDFF